MAYHREMDSVTEEIKKFEQQLEYLYAESERNPQAMIIKIDSLLKTNKNETHKYRSQLKSNIANDLNYFKAELYYKTGQYDKSLEILNKDEYQHGEIALAIAANYTKLKQHDKAKSFVDSIYKGYYIYDYALANYYETVGDKTNALKIYKTIKDNKRFRHYAYHPLAVKRFEELEKKNPKLLDELYYPTGNPDFEIAKSDNENRSKIFEMIQNMPECKEYGITIHESPQINDKDYYWIKVGELYIDSITFNTVEEEAKYNFFIYPKDFSIKYYDVKNKKLLSLEEWRKTLKK